MVIHGRLTPDVAEKVFDLLHTNDLLKCRQVSRDWKYFVDSQTKLWRESFGLAIKGGKVGEATIALIYMSSINGY